MAADALVALEPLEVVMAAACMVDIFGGSGLGPLVGRAARAGFLKPSRLWEGPSAFRAVLNPEDFAAALNRAVASRVAGATIVKTRGFWRGRTEPGAVTRIIATGDGSSGLSGGALAVEAIRIAETVRQDLGQSEVWVLFHGAAGRLSLLRIGADRIPAARDLRRLLAA